jgi:hypothetical protein
MSWQVVSQYPGPVSTADATANQAAAITSNDAGGDTESCEQFCELGVAVRVRIGTLDIEIHTAAERRGLDQFLGGHEAHH